MWLKEVDKKSKVLKEPDFGCLKGIPSINITKGCFHRCIYCYAQGFPDVPKDHVILYKNTPDLLISELESKRIKGELPWWVSFSTASDAFQPSTSIQDITYQTVEILLKSRVGVSFLTKGKIDNRFFSLFKGFSHLVHVTAGIISFDKEIHDVFEPYSAPYPVRFRQLERLKDIGIKVSVRIDPIIPYFTDKEEKIEFMFKRFKAIGIKDISISYLVLRPYILETMKQKLPSKVFNTVFSFYKTQPWRRDISCALTKLANPFYRKAKYKLFKDIGMHFGINVHICGCKNPDLPFESCMRIDKTLYLRKQRRNRISLLTN